MFLSTFLPTAVILTPTQLATEAVTLLPRLIVAVLVVVIGFILAKILKRLTKQGVEKLLTAKVLENTPLDEFLVSTDMKSRIDTVSGNVVYWLVLLFTVYVLAGTIGLTSVSELLARFFAFLPSLISAGLVFIIGIVLAGFAESFTKGSLRSLEPSTARLLSKIVSYIVIVVATMIALSELGIARDFILILFIGFTATLTLVVGLAVGLGSKDMVKEMLAKWYGQKRE